MVLEDCPLIGSSSNIVLHHVLLLGEVAIELENKNQSIHVSLLLIYKDMRHVEKSVSAVNSVFLIKAFTKPVCVCMWQPYLPENTVQQRIPLSFR